MEFGQPLQRKARIVDEFVRRWVRLGHPGREQSQGPIRLTDDEMIASRMPEGGVVASGEGAVGCQLGLHLVEVRHRPLQKELIRPVYSATIWIESAAIRIGRVAVAANFHPDRRALPGPSAAGPWASARWCAARARRVAE